MHTPSCGCSVCWAHNYCDSLKLFPLTKDELSRPFTNYYTFYDYTAQFKREQRTSARVELAGSEVRTTGERFISALPTCRLGV